MLGRTFSLSALEHASPLDRDEVLAALDQAGQLGLVTEVPGTVGHYRFGHGLIGDTLLASMTAGARMGAHAVAGQALEHVYRGAINAHLPELAHHFLSAAPRGDLVKAVDYAQRAAQLALDNLAYEQAAELFSRALAALELLESDVPRRAALLLGLGAAESRAGRPAARSTFDAAIVAARAIDDQVTFARAALGTAPFALAPGFVDDAHVALLTEALERIGSADDALRVRLLGSLARALYWSDTAARRAELAHEALTIAERLGDDSTLAFALSSAQLATSGPDTTEQGLEWLRRLFVLADRTGESALSLDARSRHVDLLLELGDATGADAAIDAAERLATAARDRRAMAFVPVQRARRLTMEGRFAEARELLAQVIDVSHEMPDTTIPLTVNSQLVVVSWLQLGAASIGDTVRGYADGVPAMPIWRAALTAALADSGRRPEAELELDRLAADGFAALPRDNLWFGAMAALADAARILALHDHALTLYEQLAPYAARNVVTPTVAFLGPVELWLGILARVGGRADLALGHLVRARVSARRSGARISLLRIAVEEAAVLLEGAGAGSASEAVARERADRLLTQAAIECEQIGLASVLDQVVGLRERYVERAAAPDAAERDATRAPAPAARDGVEKVPAPAGAPAMRTRPAPGTATLRRVGEVWTIDDGIATLYLNDARGVRLLALLLTRPGVEIPCLELVAIIDGEAPAHSGASGAQAERARVNVTRAIRSTLKRITGYDQRLGGELERSIRTGSSCRYLPDPRRPLRWTVQDAADDPG